MSEAAKVVALRPGQATKDLYEIGEIPPLGHVPSKMRAWAIRRERHGEPEKAMQVEVVPTPTLDSHDVLVMVMAAGVNYNGVWAALGRPISPFDVHKAEFHIVVENPEGVNRGVRAIELDGAAVTGDIALADATGVHQVRVVLGN